MNFKTDFLAEDYSTLCWFQSRTPTIILSFFIAAAFAFTIGSLATNIIIGAAVFAIAYLISYRVQKRGVEKRADKRFAAFATSSELDLTINDSEILQVSNSGETRLPWEDVYSVRESESSYYVFLTKNKAFYFPKRSFCSEAEKEKFLDYIRKNVSEKKIKLKK
ncbi:MAG: YcxB family protein [Oscillospiraceae bacterium]|nr:YcxB family protein [Oscillospiraceae bacterium]